MKRVLLAILCAGLIGATANPPSLAQGKGQGQGQGKRGWSFQRVGTFANYTNASIGDTTVSEMIAASADGRTLVYTDGGRGTLGFIDITNPAAPQARGTLDLDPDPTDEVTYSPTSVAVLRNQYVLAAVDTSASKVDVSGELIVIDLATRVIVNRLDLGGQPDSLKVSPDHRFIAVAIENERNEDLPLPQAPAGYLSVIETAGAPTSWVRDDVQLTGLADYFPDDPEPEFLDINKANLAVVTLQENNHIVFVDLPSRTVVTDFPAGTVNLSAIDRTRAGSGVPNTIALTQSLDNVRREPDGVAWVGNRIATANEGDLSQVLAPGQAAQGGSRGFSLFNLDGSVAFDSGNSLEHLAVRLGHYPERRSNAKGTEPESIAFAKYGPNDLLFVGSERGSFVAVYHLDRDGQPQLSQLLI